jgi:AAA+ ATPase superfamily predicted ATPase
MNKPAHLFNRDAEWRALTDFVSRRERSATLGIVSGRRRQGKSYLLQALSSAMGGLYFSATEETAALSLRAFAEAIIQQTGAPIRSPFRDWSEAIWQLLTQFPDHPLPVVIDEFPFLMRSTPALPSIIQRELGPGGSGRGSRVQLLLCGSAMSVMGGLLSGQAPLRGRAGLEMLVNPFDYRESARFWGLTDPKLAAMVHAVLGGTPAYGREFTSGDAPESTEDFDNWIVRTVLNPRSALFREARYLLAEESAVRDPAIYHSVLAAVAEGNTTSGRIAGYVGRKTSEIAHALNVLEDCSLLVREPDVFRQGRSFYRITEPLVSFYEAIMRRDWAQLEAGRGAMLWPALRPIFESQVLGPHFEVLCRQFVLEQGISIFGEHPRTVGQGVVNDARNREQIQVDVVALATSRTGGRTRILSLGEAKWGQMMDISHVERLRRARDLLAVRGFDTEHTVLSCYSGAGFTSSLRSMVRSHRPPRIQLIDLPRIYGTNQSPD